MTPDRGPEVPANGADLRRHPIFRGLSDAERDQIFAVLKPRHVKRGSTLLYDPDVVGRACFVWSGSYHLVIAVPPNTTVTLLSVRSGGALGLPLATSEARWGGSLRLLCDRSGVLLELTVAQLTAFRHAMPTLADAVLAAISTLAGDHAGRIFELSALNVRQRVNAELLRLARHGEWSGKRCIVEPMPTNQSLAAQVGATREGVSRVLRELASEGLIRIKQRSLEFLDIDRLLALDHAATGRLMFDPNARAE